ncbi:MAG: ABC transporter substrate-binding protein [Candidatus Latescibacterota bacterium]|nr:MAG: ABC transporter substrate-binding protein [Candidatus Latescibacterota bacterium]
MGKRTLLASIVCLSMAASGVQPERIISLGPALTESLFLLGAGDRVVGVTVYCKRPPEARKKEKVGTVMEVDVEKIVGLKPDLVLATSLTDPKDVEKLKDLGINVITFPNPKSFSQICEQFLKLGRLVGREREAQDIVRKARAQVDSIAKIVEGLPKPKVFVQVGAKPLFTITKGSFIDDFIKLAGGKNIAEDAKTGLYSREKVLQANPDVIIITTMGIVGEEEKRTWHKYKTLNAVKNNRIYVVDSYALCSPTPLTFAETLKELAELLHPEIGR